MTVLKKNRILALLLVALLLIGCGAKGSGADTVAVQAEDPLRELPVYSEEADISEGETPMEAFSGETVTVSNVDEFLEAIASDREIVLKDGLYSFDMAKAYGVSGTPGYHWEFCGDGYELVISDLDNLTIRAEEGAKVILSAKPRYANVIRFRFCSNVCVEGVTVGHTEGEGYCTGGVLLFEQSKEIEVRNARLYGCGTLGVDLQNCQDVHVSGTEIYECSYGGFCVNNSQNVLFEECKIHDCNTYSGVVDVICSWNVALINSEISNCSNDWGALVRNDSSALYLGGLDLHGNYCRAEFISLTTPITVERCRFQDGWQVMVDGIQPVDPQGNTLWNGDLQQMTMKYVTWQPAPMPEVPELPAAGEDGMVHVTNVDEFLAALGSDTSIYLEPGVYDLSKAATFGTLPGANYHWAQNYDGPELVIENVRNLSIQGGGTDLVQFVTTPRYANVVQFSGCDGVHVADITFGHTEGGGECSGGVLFFQNCINMDVSDCSLYGCGIVGIWGENLRNSDFFRDEIHDCSEGAIWFTDCAHITVGDCNIHDNGRNLYSLYNCTDITMDGAPMESVFID